MCTSLWNAWAGLRHHPNTRTGVHRVQYSLCGMVWHGAQYKERCAFGVGGIVFGGSRLTFQGPRPLKRALVTKALTELPTGPARRSRGGDEG